MLLKMGRTPVIRRLSEVSSQWYSLETHLSASDEASDPRKVKLVITPNGTDRTDSVCSVGPNLTMPVA